MLGFKAVSTSLRFAPRVTSMNSMSPAVHFTPKFYYSQSKIEIQHLLSKSLINPNCLVIENLR